MDEENDLLAVDSDEEDPLARFFEVISEYGRRKLPQAAPPAAGLSVGLVALEGQNLVQDVRKIKAALLYADHVQLHSFTAYWGLMAHCALPDSLDDQIELYYDMIAAKGRVDQDISKSDFVRVVRDHAPETVDHLPDHLQQFADPNAGSELEILVRSGLVSVAPVSGRSRLELASHYVHNIQCLLDDRSVLPMFDGKGTELIQQVAEMGYLVLPDKPRPHRRHAALAAELMSRLPIVDAPIEEVLGVREELSPYLAKFRGAMSKFSSDIAAEPWSEDFAYDADEVFVRQVGPAIQEIEAGVRSIRPWNKALAAAGGPWAAAGTSTTLAVAIGSANSLAQAAATAIGVVGTAASLAIVGSGVHDKIRAEQEKVEANQLYLYYEASKK